MRREGGMDGVTSIMMSISAKRRGMDGVTSIMMSISAKRRGIMDGVTSMAAQK